MFTCSHAAFGGNSLDIQNCSSGLTPGLQNAISLMRVKGCTWHAAGLGAEDGKAPVVLPSRC